MSMTPGTKKRGVPAYYALLYPNLLEIAHNCGYALALHGSLGRDMDVIAVPWIEHAVTAEELVERLLSGVGGWMYGALGNRMDEIKPHGRRAWSLFLGNGAGYIDISVMPLVPGVATPEPYTEGDGDE